ncbi:MAG: cupredoxin domain-containing protein [Actinomycetes bacterium]
MVLGLAAAALSLTAGCSAATSAAGSPVASASSTTAGSGPTLVISGFAFSTLTVKPGVQVSVSNQDSVAHTVKVNGTSIDVTVSGGGHATFTAPAKAGSYPLTCDFHASMHGTLTVAA